MYFHCSGADVHSEDIAQDGQHSTGCFEETESLYLLCVCEKISTMKRTMKHEQTTIGFIVTFGQYMMLWYQ